MLIKISFEADVDDGIGTDAELEEWMNYKYANGSISGDNPFFKHRDPLCIHLDSFEWDEI